MTASEAKAEVFLAALRALSREDRRAVLGGIADDDDLREDLLDLALIAERRGEPARPFRDLLAEKAR